MSTARELRRLAASIPLDAKRANKRMEGAESWYPFYAGFSNSFACKILAAAALPPKATVLDPWNGSGTTTYAADQLGYNAVGFDLNPVAVLVANAKLARTQDAEHVIGLARRLTADVVNGPYGDGGLPDALADWLPPTLVAQYRRIESAILADLATDTHGSVKHPSAGRTPPLASFLLLSLMRAARSFAQIRSSTNPTWIVPDGVRRGSPRAFAKRWLDIATAMAKELSSGSVTISTSEARLADARELPLPDSSVDFVLTSPPYCTRIDYVVNSSFELAALGFLRDSNTYRNLRRAAMGTPLARPGPPMEPEPTWPNSVKSMLRAIRAHASKSSSSYYYKTYWQYFNDCESALREIWRCLRKHGTAAVVLQTSYYKELYVDLPQLYADMGNSLGFAADIVSRTKVRRALAQINSRSALHRADTTYHESLLILERNT